jgi:hypothetical protein
VTLGSGNTVWGMTLGNATAGTALSGSSVGSLKIRDTTVNSSVNGVSLANGALDAIFQSISANGGTNGISLTNTTGSFTVTGTGTTTGSGGTIQNITARGASFISAQNISLSNMNFTTVGTTNGADPTVGTSTCGDHVTGTNTGCNAGINLQNVTGVTLTNVQMNGGSQEGINGNNVTNFILANSSVRNFGDQMREHGLNFINILGTSAITNCTITGNQADQIRIDNNTGTLTKLDLKDSTLGTSNAPNGEHGIAFNMHGATAQMRLQIQGVHFTNIFSNCIDAGSDGSRAAGTGGLDIVIDGTATAATNKNQFNGCGAGGINIVQQGTSDVRFNIHDNGTLANPTFLAGASPYIGSSHSINIDQAGGTPSTAVLQGQIVNNFIGNNSGSHSANSGGDGIRVLTVAPATTTVLIQGNNTQGTGSNGINVQMSETNNAAHRMNATVLSNTGKVTDVNSFEGIRAEAGASSTGGGDAGIFCLEEANNTGNAANGGGDDFNVQQRFATTMQLRGYTGGSTDTAAVQNFLFAPPDGTGNNTGVNHIFFINITGSPGGGIVNTPGPGNQCAQPSVPTLQ